MSDLRRRAEDLVERGADASGGLPDDIHDLLHELRVYQAELEIQNDELRRTNLDLEQAQRRFLRFVDSVPVGLLLVDERGLIKQCNRRFCRLAGVDDAVGRQLELLIHPEDRNIYLARWRAFRAHAQQREPQPMEFRLDAPEETWVRVGLAEVALDDGAGLSLAVTDITAEHRAEAARQEAEEQLFQARKMEAIGQLAGGVAHDFNNQLQIISGYRELIGRARDDASRNRQLSAMGKGIEASRRLVEQLLTFSRKGQIAAEPFDAADVVKDLQSIVARTFEPRIRCRTSCGPGPTVVYGSKVQLHNALLNLCVNARDAIDGEGEISIGVRRVHRQVAWASTFGGERRMGAYIELEVDDDGHGMSEETRLRAVEPFYTTKPKGHGTGLGLAAAYGLIDGMGGDFRMRSAPGEGTTITILIPAHSGPVPAHEATDPPTGAIPNADLGRGVRGAVLVVDDEPALRELACEGLTDLGLQTRTAEDGLEAVAAVERHGDDIVAVIMDLLMPNLDGAAATARIKRLRPDLPVILATGYGSTRLLDEAREAGVEAVVHKPYHFDEIASLLAKVVPRRSR